MLAIAGGAAIWAGYAWIRSHWNRAGAAAFLTVALAGIAIWTTAFSSIYRHDHPRIAASKWIYANVPMGSAISSEDWDDSLPVSFGPMQSYGDMHYQNVPFDHLRGSTPGRGSRIISTNS